jgi:hypothetical protein
MAKRSWVLYHAVLYGVPCSAVWCTMQCCMVYHAVLYVVPCSAVWCTMQWFTYIVPCSAVKVPCCQGDQIGRIFAYWVTVYFG